MSGLALGYFFLLPPLSPDKYFLRQILKTGAKLGQIFAILIRNSVYTHVGFSMSHLIAQLAPSVVHSRPPSHPTVTCDRHNDIARESYIRISFDEHVCILLPFSCFSASNSLAIL